MFGNNRELSDDAAKGLSELSSLGWVGRWRVGHDIFTDTPFAAAFASGPSYILRGLARLDPSRLEAIVDSHLTAEALHEHNARLGGAIVALIGATPPTALGDATLKDVSRQINEAAAQNIASVDWNAVVQGLALESFATQSTEELASLRGAIEKTTDSDQLSALSEAYARVAEKLKESEPQVLEQLVAVRDLIGRTTNGKQLSALSDAYAKVAGKLKEGDPKVLEELVAVRGLIDRATDEDQLPTLANVYLASVSRLKDGDFEHFRRAHGSACPN